MHFWAMWLMTCRRLPDISGFPSGCRRGGLVFTELHSGPPWWVPRLLGSPSHGQPGLPWWLFLVPRVTGSHAPAVPCLTCSLCSRASLWPWAQQRSRLPCACVCFGPLSQAGEAAGSRMQRWAHSLRQAGTNAMAHAASVTSAVWGSGCLTPEEQSWNVVESISHRATWIGTGRHPSFSLSDRPSWKAMFSRSSLERPRETELLMCLLLTHY